MPRKPTVEPSRCDKCNGTGRVPSRLPFRDKMCEWCGGKGYRQPKPAMAKKPGQSRWSRR